MPPACGAHLPSAGVWPRTVLPSVTYAPTIIPCHYRALSESKPDLMRCVHWLVEVGGEQRCT
jgi:hypothetical protein